MAGDPIQFNGNLTFDSVLWDENLIYNDSKKIGLLDQTFTNFDGVSCTNSNYEVNFVKPFSYLSYKLMPFTNEMKEFTIEFWVKRNIPLSTLNYLFSLSSNDREYFGIYQEENYKSLVCKPFSDNESVKV